MIIIGEERSVPFIKGLSICYPSILHHVSQYFGPIVALDLLFEPLNQAKYAFFLDHFPNSYLITKKE